MTTMELRHLKSFLTVAEELNFRRAAERLFITQPPLTRQIQELEREIGVLLFERNGKRIKLTEAGEYLRGEARLMLDHVDDVKRQVIAVQDREQSRLRIGFVEYVLQTFLPDIFMGIFEISPNIGIGLFEMSTDQQIDALLHDRIDAGFIRNWWQVKELEYEKIFDESLVAVCSPKLLKNAPLRVLEDLSELPFIAFSRTGAPGLVGRIEDVFKVNGFLPKVVFEGGSLETIYRLAASGLGWAIVPSFPFLHPHRITELVALEISNPKETIELGIAWRKGRNNPNIELLREVTRKSIGVTAVKQIKI